MASKPKIGTKRKSTPAPSAPKVDDPISFEEDVDMSAEEEEAELDETPTVEIRQSKDDEIAFTTLRKISPAPTIGDFSFRSKRGLAFLDKHKRYTAPRRVVMALLDSGAITLSQ